MYGCGHLGELRDAVEEAVKATDKKPRAKAKKTRAPKRSRKGTHVIGPHSSRREIQEARADLHSFFLGVIDKHHGF